MREVLIEFMDGTNLRLELDGDLSDLAYGTNIPHYICTISGNEKVYIPMCSVKHMVVRDIKKEVDI